MKRLNNKVAVVTGSSSGIGRGIAEAFAQEGASVVVNYRNSTDKAETLVKTIKAAGGHAIAVQADMSKQDDIEHLISRTIELFGCIDVWVNNAGADILTGEGAKVGLAEKLDCLIEVDFKGTIIACWSVAKIMQKQGYGNIINMSWDLSLHGFSGSNPQVFAATKAGVLGFTRSFAKSVGPEIRANVISPGWISTDFVENCMEQQYYHDRISEIPLGRFGRPKDVAAVAVFLASEASSYLTGEVIKINGGLV